MWHAREEQVHTKFRWGNLKEGDHFGAGTYTGVNMEVCLQETREGMDWIHLAQHRGKWWALGNTVCMEFLDYPCSC
jgi:hypothetical protein